MTNFRATLQLFTRDQVPWVKHGEIFTTQKSKIYHPTDQKWKQQVI